MSEAHSTLQLVDIIKFLAGGALGLIVWIFTRNLGRIDNLESKISTLVTKKEVQERCETLANLIKESQRADRAEIRAILQEEIQNAMAPHLHKKDFGALKYGFVGEIEDDDK